jgi:hypothetical protein
MLSFADSSEQMELLGEHLSGFWHSAVHFLNVDRHQLYMSVVSPKKSSYVTVFEVIYIR